MPVRMKDELIAKVDMLRLATCGGRMRSRSDLIREALEHFIIFELERMEKKRAARKQIDAIIL